MEEVIAKGRFPWARLVVTYWNGTKIFEDRSDEYFWDKLPKRGISALGIQYNGISSPTYMLEASVDHNYQFFMYRKKEMLFFTGQTKDLAFGVGMVTDKDGTCCILEVKPDGSVSTFMSNVIADGRNLELHGIKLEEIY